MIGKSFSRKEDLPLITGNGRYLDDYRLPGMVHLGLVRSPHANARVTSIAKSEAQAMPGVLAVLSAADLPEAARPMPAYRRSERRFRRFDQSSLSTGIVRYVGEPVVVVVAEDRRTLADALEAVAIEYEPLPAAATLKTALSPVKAVHEGWQDNIAYVTRKSVGDVDSEMGKADEIVTERFRHARSAGMPIEPRGVLAYVDATSGVLVVISST